MNFKRLSLVTVQAISLGLLPTAAFAQIAATNDSFFSGTVPASCTITGGNTVTSSADLTYSTADSGSLSGETDEIVVTCNSANVLATLGPVIEGNNPTTTTNTATLTDSSEQIVITNSTTSTSAATGIANVANQDSSFFVSMAATGASVPGVYVYNVVLTTLE